jgi:flagellin-like hook-associated protein FlgL
MTIINRQLYPLQTSMSLINKMTDQFGTLQQQLATGQKANTLADMGTSRSYDLSLRAASSRIDSYAGSIQMVNTRLTMFNTVTSQLATIQSTAQSAMTPSAYGSSNGNFGTTPSLAYSNLDQVVNLLDTDVAGRYLFSGNKTDAVPVPSTDELINGANGKAGFAQVASERQQADVGDGMGRLTLSSTADTATLAEDAAQPFGFKLSTASTTSAAVTLTQPNGTAPQSLGVQFTALPTDGDKITVGLTLPDGTSDSITLTATTGTPGTGQFQVGADATATAANFTTALQSSIQSEAGTTLVAASNNQAANEFFTGQGQTQMRVQGPNFATATQLVAADPTNTVTWYQGGDSADARGSITAKIDDHATVQYGAQANENGTVNLVRALAVMSIQNFSNSDATSGGRFDAIATRNQDRLAARHASEPGSINMLTVELANAQTTTSNVSKQQTAYQAQLTNMVSDLETVPQEQVATELLALQTRLQASYQATSLIAHLSLVNYLPTG